MNIVYMLTNKRNNKKYIGAKQECQLVEIDGISTIWDNKVHKPYYGSSSNIDFKNDFLGGDIFEAKILENVKDKTKLVNSEDYYINLYDAVNNNAFYNLANAYLNCFNQEAISNVFGETIKELARNRSSISKRDKTAKNCGFSNFGELAFYIYQKYKSGMKYVDISTILNKHRHFSAVFIKPFNMEKAISDLDKNLKNEIRILVAKGASLQKASNILSIEVPTARLFLGDYNNKDNLKYLVAHKMNMTKKELEVVITKKILEGDGFNKVGHELFINPSSVKRYFFRCIRRNLKNVNLK